MADNTDFEIDMEAEYGTDTVPVNVRLTTFRGITVPDEDGSVFLGAVFKKLTVGDHLSIEKKSYTRSISTNGIDISSSDYSLYRSLILRRCLISIDGFKPERKNGWITADDWKKVKGFNAMVLNAVLSEFEQKMMVCEDDEKLIAKQSAILFGTDSGKVMNPHPAIASYCTISGIWEKFGISASQTDKMSYDEYLRLKEVLSNEAEQMRKNK